MSGQTVYEKLVGGIEVSVPGNIKTIEFPSRTLITKLVVVQTVGALVPFTVNLYNARLAAENASISDDEGGGVLPRELFKVIPSQAGANGTMEYFPLEPRTFFNMDGDDNLGNQRLIYLEIIPDSGSGLEFAVALGGQIRL